MTATTRGEGPIDRYLDEMFDQLAGTGADGRRLLAEAGEHLTEAAADARARGLDAEAAEREAVERFGPAATVTRRLPANTGIVRVSLRRLAIATWALTGTALAWHGLSGALTRLLSWPWTWLLVATDRFGGRPVCRSPEVPLDADECVSVYHEQFNVLLGIDDLSPYLYTAGIGTALIVALLIVRRATALGAPPWTPSRTATGLGFAIPFVLGGAALVIEGLHGMALSFQYYVLANLVAGLLAAAIGAVALRLARRRRPGMAATGPLRW